MRCSQGRFYVGYRIQLSAYFCVPVCLSGIITLLLAVFFVYSCVLLCDLCVDFSVH